MGDLKPIGSEKLQGVEKINRILEIARYKENSPSKVNENAKSVYEIGLYDGNKYNIVKERLGYVIKKQISESEEDYIEPMKNRKYYPSYSQALKRLNLLTKEVNRLNDITEGQSLFSEQKKFVLKTPSTPKGEDEGSVPAPPPPPAEPPTVPQPELPPSPEGGAEGELPPTDSEAPMEPEMEPEMGPGMEGEEDTEGQPKEDEGVSFKMIQKLTGKLTQKIREFENEKGLTSENIKYVINMVLSSLDLTALSEEDKEDILMKFEGDEEMGGSEDDMNFEGDDETPDEGGMPSEPPLEEPTGEMGEVYGSILDSIFKESKVDKVISKYFDITTQEKKYIKESTKEKNFRLREVINQKMKEVNNLTETYEQELASQKFLEQNPRFTFVGKTNKKNLVFEHRTKQIRISPEGMIL